MALFETLTEDWSSGTVSATKWPHQNGTLAVVGGLLRMTPAVNAPGQGYGGNEFGSAFNYTLNNSRLIVQIATPILNGSASTESRVFVDDDAGTRLAITIKGNGKIQYRNETGYYDPAPTEEAYNAADHVFVGFISDGTNVTFVAGPDTHSMTIRRTIAQPAWMNDANSRMNFETYKDAVGGSDYSEIGLINLDLTAPPTQHEDADNYVHNPTGAVAGWVTDFAGNFTAGAALTGTCRNVGVRADLTAQDNVFLAPPRIPVNPGEVWTLAVEGYCSSGAATQAGTQIYFYDETSGQYQGHEDNIIANPVADQVYRFPKTVTVPTGVTHLELNFYVQAAPNGSSVYATGARAVLGAYATLPFRDGDTYGWDWNGDPTDSSSIKTDYAEAVPGAHPTGTDALQTRTLDEVKTWEQWLSTNGAEGYVGEYGTVTVWHKYGDDAQQAQWDALLDVYLQELDYAGLSGTEWSSGREFNDGYPLALMVGTNVNDPLTIAHPTYTTSANHPSRNGQLHGSNLAGYEHGINVNGGNTVRTQVGYVHDYPDFAFMVDHGVDTVRLPIAWERIQPGLGGALTTSDLDGMLTAAELSGISVILDIHNYARYTDAGGVAYILGGGTIDNGDLGDLWQKLATWVKANHDATVVGYGLMNEPHDMPGAVRGGAETWETCSQYVLNVIRQGANDDRLVLVAGYAYSSLTNWTKWHPAGWITDSANNFKYEAHHYWDTQSVPEVGGPTSGTYQQRDPDGTFSTMTYSRELAAAENTFTDPWSANFDTANDIVAAGFHDYDYNRQTAAGNGGNSGLPWPIPLEAAPGGRDEKAVPFYLPANSKRDEAVPDVGGTFYASNDSYYFGQAFYLDAGFPAGTNYQVISQFRQANDQSSPGIAFEILGDELRLTGGYGIYGDGATYQYSETLKTGLNTEAWYSLIFKVEGFSYGDHHTKVTVWLDGTKLLTDYQVAAPTVVPTADDADGATYWKVGLYHDPANAAGTIYQAGHAFGDTYAAVDTSNLLHTVDPPTVNAGADATVNTGDTFTRTATEVGDAITARSWTVVSGPEGAGTQIGDAAALSWKPGSSPANATDIRFPVFQEMAFELTSTAENSTTDWTQAYDYIEDIGDNRGYTAGLSGFTSATGDMLTLVEHYTDLNPGNQLNGWHDELVTLANEGMSANAGNRADQLLGNAFKTAWVDAATYDPLFREAQRDKRRIVYWQPALDEALADEVGALGVAVLFDILTNHGPGNDPESFGGIVQTAKSNAAPPSQGGSEHDYIKALIDAREAVLINWGDNPTDGRVSVHRALLATGNYTFTGTVSWSMYGDPFSFNRPDPPADSVRGDYVLEYAATNTGGTDTDDLTLTVSGEAGTSYSSGSITSVSSGSGDSFTERSGSGDPVTSHSEVSGESTTIRTGFTGEITSHSDTSGSATGSHSSFGTAESHSDGLGAGKGAHVGAGTVESLSDGYGDGEQAFLGTVTSESVVSGEGSGAHHGSGETSSHAEGWVVPHGYHYSGGEEITSTSYTEDGTYTALHHGDGETASYSDGVGHGNAKQLSSAGIARPMVGLALRLIDDDGLPAEFLPDWTELAYTERRNATGTVGISYASNGVDADLLKADRTEGALFDGAKEVAGTRFLVTQTATDAVKEDESGNTVVLNCPQLVPQRLQEATVYPEDWPNNKTANKIPFAAKTPGYIIGWLLGQAKDRGAVTEVVQGWDTNADSVGRLWSQVVTLEVEPGGSILSVIEKLTEIGVVDWDAHARELRLWEPTLHGQDRTVVEDPVILYSGRDILDAPEKRDASNLMSVCLVVGKDGRTVEVVDQTAIQVLGRIEGYVSVNNVDDDGTLRCIGEATLDKNRLTQEELTHELALFDKTSQQPWVDYYPSDWVWRDVADGRKPQRYRVSQLSITYSKDGKVTGAVTLGNRFESAVQKLTAKLDALTNGSGASSSAPAPSPGLDLIAPNVPDGLVLTSDAYTVPNGGGTFAAVQAIWAPVTRNEDGSQVSDLEGYEVRWRNQSDYQGTVEFNYDLGEAACEALYADEFGNELNPDFTYVCMRPNLAKWAPTLRQLYVQAEGPNPPWQESVYKPFLQNIKDGNMPAAADTWADVGEVPNNVATWSPVPTHTGIAVQVRAKDRNGNVSDWCPDVYITTASDDIPPPVPSTPTMSNYLGVLKAEWDGKGVDSGVPVDMPRDFMLTEVHVSDQGATFEPTDATHVDNLSGAGISVIADLTYDRTYYVRLISVDTSSNKSGASDSASAVPEQVVHIDMGPDAIDSEQIRDLAVLNAKIADLAVNDAKIANLSVGKLTTGILDADVAVAGRITTSLTGQRIELNDQGLQKYDANNNKVVDISDAETYIEGTLVTGELGGSRITMFASGSDRHTVLAYDVNGHFTSGFGQFYDATGVQPLSNGLVVNLAGASPTINLLGCAGSSVDGKGIGFKVGNSDGLKMSFFENDDDYIKGCSASGNNIVLFKNGFFSLDADPDGVRQSNGARPVILNDGNAMAIRVMDRQGNLFEGFQVSYGNHVDIFGSAGVQVLNDAGTGYAALKAIIQDQSSRKFKRDIRPFESSTVSVREQLTALKPVVFYFNDEVNTGERVGFIAEEVMEASPQASNGEGVNPTAISALIRARQLEQDKELDNLLNRLALLEHANTA